jgi:single-strand DNA-binding protein
LGGDRSDDWREAMRTTNLFILRGYVGQEPKAFDNGKIAKVSVATNRSWTDKKSRERIEKTDWVTVTVLNERDAVFVLKNVRKGAPIYAECRVAETSYEKDGKTIYGVDVVANVFDVLSRADSGEDEAA